MKGLVWKHTRSQTEDPEKYQTAAMIYVCDSVEQGVKLKSNRWFSWLFIAHSWKCEIGCDNLRCMPCRVLKNLISSLLFIYLFILSLVLN